MKIFIERIKQLILEFFSKKNIKGLEDRIILSSLMNNIDAHIYWKNKNGVYMGCNDKQAKRLGLANGYEVVGKSDFELGWSKGTAEEFRKNDLEIMETNRSMIKEEPALIKDEKRIMFSVKAPLMKDGKSTGILGISIDITDKKKLEQELEEKNVELERVLAKYKDFVMNQEHDIRTPVSNVVGLSNALIDMVSDPTELELAKTLHKSAIEQKDYLNSLLDSIYLFENETEEYYRRFELLTVVEKVKAIYACAFKEKQLNFSIECSDKIPKKLWGDWFRLQQILVCLLSNAVKFTEPDDYIWLRCDTASKSDNRVVLSIEVEDTGIGIESDKLDTIFEPFARLTLSNLGKYSGRGLGLTFVKKMVAELNGEIEVKSTLGKGSVFHLLIPSEISLSSRSTSEPKGKPLT